MQKYIQRCGKSYHFKNGLDITVLVMFVVNIEMLASLSVCGKILLRRGQNTGVLHRCIMMSCPFLK